MFPIIAKESLAPGVYRFRVEAPLVAEKAKPGQFIVLIIDDKGERVPFSLSGWDVDRGTIDFVFIAVGRTTRQLAQLGEGDGLAHLVGPLGRPAHIDAFGHVVSLVTGYGMAAVAPILQALREKGNRITTIVQAHVLENIFGLERLERFSDEVVLAVAHGSQREGTTGIEELRRLLEQHPRRQIDRVLAMGSICIMRFVTELTRPLAIPTFVHMTPIMVDGTGMCGACRLQVSGTNRFACVHGPEFDAHKIESWEVLMARRCSYADENILQQGYQCRTCSMW
jgi:ferredoxin--NADP+ reductase